MVGRRGYGWRSSLTLVKKESGERVQAGRPPEPSPCTAQDMGNTFVRRHRLHFLCWLLPPPEGGGTGCAVGPRARDHGMNPSAPIVAQLAQQYQPKVHFVAP